MIIFVFARDDPPARSESEWALNSTFSCSGNLRTSLKRFLRSAHREVGPIPNCFKDFLICTRFSPQTDSVKTFPCIYDNTHHFIISFLLKCLTDRRKHLLLEMVQVIKVMFKWEEVISMEGGYSVEPQLVDTSISFEL